MSGTSVRGDEKKLQQQQQQHTLPASREDVRREEKRNIEKITERNI